MQSEIVFCPDCTGPCRGGKYTVSIFLLQAELEEEINKLAIETTTKTTITPESGKTVKFPK